jgi:riboflavin kinase/FMN adenylyltransferase
MVVALSVFDGVHRGHRAILTEVKRIAAEQNVPVGVLLVDGGVHYGARMLTTLEHRLELLDGVGGIASVWVIPGDVHERPGEVIGMAVDRIHPAMLCASAVLLKLGRQKRLTPDELEAICEARHVAVHWLDGVLPGHNESIERLYTTRYISDLLEAGNVSVAGRLLGRPYEMRGHVEHGDHRGRTIGVPTANLSVSSTLLIPAEGVYAGIAITEDGRRHAAAISLGRRATFYEDGWELLEAHLLDFEEDIYGTALRVLFTDHLRKQQRFSAVDELISQLKMDITLVRELDPLGEGRRSTPSGEPSSVLQRN